MESWRGQVWVEVCSGGRVGSSRGQRGESLGGGVPCPEGTLEPISWEHFLQEVLGLAAAAVQNMNLTWMFAPVPRLVPGWMEGRGGEGPQAQMAPGFLHFSAGLCLLPVTESAQSS